jgi:hypothetical protein
MMLDYRIHYAILAAEDRLEKAQRKAIWPNAGRPGPRVHRLPMVDRKRTRG